jgi:hypothetical protein
MVRANEGAAVNLLKGTMRPEAVTSAYLLAALRKDQRTGTWRRLHFLDKALFKASYYYLRHGWRIRNESLLVKLERLVELLIETRGQRIVSRGLAKAAALLRDGVEMGIFSWVPRMKEWLKDPDYIFWLGTMW